MTLATTPTNRIAPLTPKFEMIVNRRWKEWEAAVIVWMSINKPYAPLGCFMDIHHQWMSALLSRGVPLKSIRKWNIDDPRETSEVLEQRVAEYIERRQRRHKHAE